MKQAFGPGTALRAALQMTGSTYVIYAAGLVVSALIARSIGPEQFGHYSYLVWLAGVLILISNNGLTTSGIRFVSECLGRDSPEDAANVHGWLLKHQLACIALVSLLYLFAMPYFRPAGWDSGSLWLFAAIVLVSSTAKTMYLFNISIAKGHGRFDVEAYSAIVISLLNAIAVVILWWMHAALLAYLILFAITCVAYASYATMKLHRGGMRAHFKPLDAALLKRLRHHLVWTVVLTLAAVFSNKSIETWMLNDRIGAAEVAYFTIAASLTRGGLDLLSSGLNTVLMPSMAHAFGASGQQRVNEILSNSLRYFHFLGLMLAGVGVLWSEPAVALMYGPRYATVVDLLRIMVVVGGLTLSEGAFGALLSTTDNQRVRAIFASLSIVFTAIAAIALIPTYGLYGAVAAHAISRSLVFILTLAGIVRIFSLRLPWREIGLLFASALVAAVAAGVLVWALPGPWTELAAGVLYALVYVGMTLRLHAWHHRDAHEVLMLAERYPVLLGWIALHIKRWRDDLERR